MQFKITIILNITNIFSKLRTIVKFREVHLSCLQALEGMVSVCSCVLDVTVRYPYSLSQAAGTCSPFITV